MKTLRNKPRLVSLILCLFLTGSATFGAWQDKTAGLPIVQNITAKELGSSGMNWIVLEDKLGRLFVGSDQLHVFDGQTWQSLSLPNGYAVRGLALGENDRLWVGAINEVGYFEEPSTGSFRYQSLISFLPKDEQLVGDVWACALVGKSVYFVCRDRLLRWNGSAFQIWHYDGKLRLFPLKVENEHWFHHVETGLYRITEDGPQLTIPATKLPNTGILGLANDQDGLLLASAAGFYRPGDPSHQVFSTEVNRYITDSKLACFAVLPDGNYALGTIDAGLALISKAGQLTQVLDAKTSLPTRSILSIAPDLKGFIFCTANESIFRLSHTGYATLHNQQTGLDGQGASRLFASDSRIFALNSDGAFVLDGSSEKRVGFKQLAQIKKTYNSILMRGTGLLLGRFGGLDFFDQSNVNLLVNLPGGSVDHMQPSRTDANMLYAIEGFGLARLVVQSDGTFVHTHFLKLPDFGSSLFEESNGQLWISTNSQGGFTYNPQKKSLTPIVNPVTGKPMTGPALVAAIDERVLLFIDKRIFQLKNSETAMTALSGITTILPIETQLLPDGKRLVVAFRHSNRIDESVECLGVLDFDSAGTAHWRELDVPVLSSIGFIRDLDFTVEDGRPILWVGGSEGLLRLDYDAISPVQKPTTPIVLLDTTHSSHSTDTGGISFPFRNHQVSLKTFTGDYARGKDWLFQTRLGSNSDWSAPAARRSFEFTNLSEGRYNFEVRAVNSANMTSAPASFAFTILPPWYRSNWAYTGYVAGLGVAVLGFIRIRDRRIRHRNRELEALVEARTAELVQANAVKDEFLASISHEIRNPMNGVLGIAESFRTENLDPEGRHKFGLLRQCASHLSSLLEDILDFSRVQAGAEELEAKPFNLRELVESITAITAADSERCGITVETAVSPLLPPQLTGDARRVRQILLNFVGNALKYAGRGQVSVTVWGKLTGPKSAEIIFAVSDEGPGIRPEDREKLFTRFERGSGARFGRVPGSGLGLALCKALAVKMGGRVWLESEPGAGSCFYFSAPFAVAEDTAGATATWAQPGGGLFRTALVVDDEEYNRIALTGLLEAFGLAVQTADSGTAAHRLAGDRDFDLVFLDYALPGQSGPDIARDLRRLPNRSAQAVIFAVTAFNTPEKRAQCLAAGMNAFLSKPVTIDRLRQALAAVTPATPARLPPLAAGESLPTGPLRNLHLLAAKKRVPVAEEVSRYLADFERELEQLTAALQQELAAQAVHYAHLLRGRCAFIHENDLELTLHRTGAATAAGHWEEARLLGHDARNRLAELRLRLASLAPAARPASDH